ncbi:MAG TPA: hypothetical protein VIK01_07955 [Polyangiaceae bacterium]
MISLSNVLLLISLSCLPSVAFGQTVPSVPATKPAKPTSKPPPKPAAAPATPAAAVGASTSALDVNSAESTGIPATPEAPPKRAPSIGGATIAGNTKDAVENAFSVCAALTCKASDADCSARQAACDAAKPKEGLKARVTLTVDPTTSRVKSDASAADCRNPASSCYPSYWRRHGVDLNKLADGSNSQDLRKILKRSANVAGVDTVVVAALGGLQTFLIDRAKAETIDYTVAQLNGQICAKYSGYLPNTCALLKASDLNLDDATLLRFKVALQQDFLVLPSTVFAQLPAAKTPEEAATRVFVLSGLNTFAEVATGSLPPKSIPEAWAKKDADGVQLKLNCALTDKPMSGACWALLLPELGKAAVEINVDWTPENIALAIEQASISFCQQYGDPKLQADGACLLQSPDEVEKILANFQDLARASTRFAELQKSVEALTKQGTPPAEIAGRLLPEYADAFEQWGAAFDKIAPADVASSTLTFKRIGVSLRAIGAVAARDYPTFVAVVASSAQPGEPFDGLISLPKPVLSGLGFAARLAAAKTAGDAKKVFEDQAAPLGSYKVKYSRETYTFAINAFVGPFVGGGPFLKSETNKKSQLAFRPLSAPLGIDWTAPSWQYAHVGVLLAVIDPFAAGTINSDSKAQDFDWGAVFTPGLFFRVGLGGSPFTLLAGGVAQPFAKSSDECTTNNGAAPCWKGQFQFGGALAVDVPLLVLH